LQITEFHNLISNIACQILYVVTAVVL